MPLGDGGTYGTGFLANQGFLGALTTDFFLPRVNDAKNNKCVVLEVIPSNSDRIAGKHVIEPVKFGRNYEAISAVRDRGKLPDPQSAQAAVYAYRSRKVFFRAVIDGDILRATQMDAVRFVDALSDIMEQGSDDLAMETARMLHGDGSGRIAEINATANSATQTLRMSSGLESSTTCSGPSLQNWLQAGGVGVGSRLAFWSPNGQTLRGIRTIATQAAGGIGAETFGPPYTLVITLDASISTTIGDWVTRVANTTATTARDSGNRAEPMGLAGIFSDQGVLDGHGIVTAPTFDGVTGTYNYVPTEDYSATNPTAAGFQGIIADSSRPFNQAIVMTGGGTLRPPSEELLQSAFSRAEEDNNAMIELILSGSFERDKYGEGLLPDKRYNNTTTLSGGWTGLDFKGKTWVADRLCPRNRIYMLALASAGFTQHVQTSFQPLDPLGAHWYRSGADDDQYQGAWVMSYNVGVGVRQRAGVLLTDIQRAA